MQVEWNFSKSNYLLIQQNVKMITVIEWQSIVLLFSSQANNHRHFRMKLLTKIHQTFFFHMTIQFAHAEASIGLSAHPPPPLRICWLREID